MNATRHPQHHAPGRFASFREFYPFYLEEHSNPTCRRLHVVGTASALVILLIALVTRQWMLLGLALLAGYGFAWVGHYFFQHNQPATFKHPFYSFAGDFQMLRDVLTGRIRW
jgi:hypothetical protein